MECSRTPLQIRRKKEFAARNVILRAFSRSSSVIIATTMTAMPPFFGDINSLIGAFGFIPPESRLYLACSVLQAIEEEHYFLVKCYYCNGLLSNRDYSSSCSSQTNSS
ncbi:hypothetical protein Peur_015061 [Populus x canadensis]